MVAVPLLKMAPPFLAVLFVKVEPLTVRKELPFVLRTPAPYFVVLEFLSVNPLESRDFLNELIFYINSFYKKYF